MADRGPYIDLLLSDMMPFWALADAKFRLCSRYLHNINPARRTQEPQWNKLCQICQTFASEALSEALSLHCGYKIAFHDINRLHKSAKKGCHLCNLILAELPESEIVHLRKSLKLNPSQDTSQLDYFVERTNDPHDGDHSHRRIRLRHVIQHSSTTEVRELVAINITDMRGK